jgi:hypothetical protein
MTDAATDSNQGPTPGLAIVLDGHLFSVPAATASQLIATDQEIGREWRRAHAKFGARGQVILIDDQVVERVLRATRAAER